MKRLAQLVIWRIWRQFLDWSGAWWFLLTLLVGQAVGPLMGMFVWSTVFPNDPMITSYFLALVAVRMMTASYENHTFSEAVYQGHITHDLLKPQPVVIGPFGENIAIRIWMVLFGLPMVVIAGLLLDVTYVWTDLVMAVVAVGFGALLRFLWTWILALMAFWTERVHAVVGFGEILIFLLGGAAAPIGLLPEPWRGIAEVLPFYAMLGLPAEIATGRLGAGDITASIGLQLGWCVVLGAVAASVWKIGIRRFTAVGA